MQQQQQVAFVMPYKYKYNDNDNDFGWIDWIRSVSQALLLVALNPYL